MKTINLYIITSYFYAILVLITFELIWTVLLDFGEISKMADPRLQLSKTKYVIRTSNYVIVPFCEPQIKLFFF